MTIRRTTHKQPERMFGRSDDGHTAHLETFQHFGQRLNPYMMFQSPADWEHNILCVEGVNIKTVMCEQCTTELIPLDLSRSSSIRPELTTHPLLTDGHFLGKKKHFVDFVE